MFLVLEGIDGSGKSDVAKRLADKLPGTVYATPPEQFRKSRKSVDSGKNLKNHYEFYRDSIYVASKEIGNLISLGQNVICDRYWFSTVAYHRAGGMSVDSSDFSQVLQPDLTVLLTVSQVARLARLTSRQGETGDIRGKEQELTNLFCQVLLESSLSFVILQTDRLNLAQVSDILLAVAQAHLNSPSL